MKDVLQLLPGVGVAIWAVWDRRPRAFAAAAVLFLGAAATPFLLQSAHPISTERMGSSEEVVAFALMTGFPAIGVGVMALLTARTRGNTPLPTSSVVMFLLLLGLGGCLVLFMSVAWAM